MYKKGIQNYTVLFYSNKLIKTSHNKILYDLQTKNNLVQNTPYTSRSVKVFTFAKVSTRAINCLGNRVSRRTFHILLSCGRSLGVREVINFFNFKRLSSARIIFNEKKPNK